MRYTHLLVGAFIAVILTLNGEYAAASIVFWLIQIIGQLEAIIRKLEDK